MPNYTEAWSLWISSYTFIWNDLSCRLIQFLWIIVTRPCLTCCTHPCPVQKMFLAIWKPEIWKPSLRVFSCLLLHTSLAFGPEQSARPLSPWMDSSMHVILNIDLWWFEESFFFFFFLNMLHWKLMKHFPKSPDHWWTRVAGSWTQWEARRQVGFQSCSRKHRHAEVATVVLPLAQAQAPSLGIFLLGYVHGEVFPFPCFQASAITASNGFWKWCCYLSHLHPWWHACCCPSCSRPESGSLRSAGFKVQGKERAIADGDTKNISDAQNTLLAVKFLLPFSSEQSRIFPADFTEKIRIWNERWQNVLPRSITVSFLKLADNSWQVIYIPLLLTLPFISSVVNLLEVFLIRVVFANHMVYFY